MKLVSACLAGLQCKYDGGDNFNQEVYELVVNGEAILVCPEVMGGLSTPRVPAEIIGDKVINKEGVDVTHEFIKGAEKALEIALKYKIEDAILKARSPSCGCGVIYDGSHTGTLTEGNGFTAALLMKHGINVKNES